MNTSPPDIRLARAFKFNMEDLTANRNGLLSWRQRGLSDWIAYRVLYALRQLPIVGQLLAGSQSPKKQPRHVQSLCGRIKLEHHIVDRRLDRSVVFYEYYHLVFPGHERYFVVNRDQHNALTENLKYRVYYQALGEQKHILSIERIIGSCDDENATTNQ